MWQNDEFIYHEKQAAGLCGVHCLNNLMQQAWFTEVDLMQIAHELDQKEKEYLAEAGTDSKDFLQFVGQDSHNVSDEGNFSIQVLTKALEVVSLSATNITSPEMRDANKNPQKEKAFICNLMDHWFTIRKIGGEWYNLNSLFKKVEQLTATYLQVYLEQLKVEGYTVFVIRGNLPACEADTFLTQQKVNQPQQNKNKHNEDEDIELAIAMSLSMNSSAQYNEKK